jgi:Patatin-like phospholipase
VASQEQALIARMHGDPEPLAALCLSGGGIRSATFSLGAIQGLAERGLLSRFDYLSTVSGGGYIGSWLTAWAHRSGGLKSVVPCLCRDAPATTAGAPDPIQHLREYNSYMSPQGGAMSTDLWTLIATVLRNILLNWMVLIPVLMCALMVPRLYLAALATPERLFGAAIFPEGLPPDWRAPALDVVSGSPLVAVALPILSALLLATALFFTLRYLPGVGGRDHTRYDFSLKVLAPLVGAVLTFLMFDSLYYIGSAYVDESRAGPVIVWTLVPCAAAWLLVLVTRRGTARQRLHLLFGPLSLAIFAMAAGTGAATWAVTNFVLWSPNPDASPSWAAYVTVGPPAVLVGFALGTVLFVGLSSRFLKDDDREWMSRAIGTVLLFSVAWTGICGMVLLLPHWALGWRTWAHGALAAAAAASAWLSTFGGRSTPASPSAAGRSSRAPWLSVAAKLAPPVFLALLAGALSVLTNLILFATHSITGLPLSGAQGEAIAWTDHYAMLTRSGPALLAIVALGFIAMSVLMARFININTFSLHGMYRDRLVRAYLGASNGARRASRFTGFAATDDLPMRALDPAQKPLHVVNLALNLVGGSRLAWQQRKAASFTVTALHSGSHDLGYRPSSHFGGGITLGTAVAISGAAASPNMGYHSSSVVGFIMTLFNARLGSWLGNPGAPGKRTWRDPGPLSAVRSMIKEALGQTSDQSEYVYLSDGGHFENLGIYEMVRRRCRFIVVLDSGCDPDFHYDDLGNALRKIRIDLRIPIDFDDEQRMRPVGQQKQRCAVGTIRYSAVDGPGTDGRLVYVKPMLLGNEGPDIASYAASHQAFPHEGTGDQWFDESQTESYRSLGLHTVDEICRGWKGGAISDLCAYLETASTRRGSQAPLAQ